MAYWSTVAASRHEMKYMKTATDLGMSPTHKETAKIIIPPAKTDEATVTKSKSKKSVDAANTNDDKVVQRGGARINRIICKPKLDTGLTKQPSGSAVMMAKHVDVIPSRVKTPPRQPKTTAKATVATKPTLTKKTLEIYNKQSTHQSVVGATPEPKPPRVAVSSPPPAAIYVLDSLKNPQPSRSSWYVTTKCLKKVGDFARAVCPVPWDTVWCGLRDGNTIILDEDNGSRLYLPLPPISRTAGRTFVTCIVCDVVGNVWVGDTAGTIQIYRGLTGDFLGQFLAHHGQVRTLHSSVGSELVLSGGNDFVVKAWDVRISWEGGFPPPDLVDLQLRSTTLQTPLWQLTGHDNNVRVMAAVDDIGVSGTDSGQIRVWDVRTGKEGFPPIHPHKLSITAVAISNPYVYTASEDRRLKVISVISGEILHEVNCEGLTPDVHITSLWLNPGGGMLWCGGTDGVIHVYPTWGSTTLLDTHRGKQFTDHVGGVVNSIVPTKLDKAYSFYIVAEDGSIVVLRTKLENGSEESEAARMESMAMQCGRVHGTAERVEELKREREQARLQEIEFKKQLSACGPYVAQLLGSAQNKLLVRRAMELVQKAANRNRCSNIIAGKLSAEYEGKLRQSYYCAWRLYTSEVLRKKRMEHIAYNLLKQTQYGMKRYCLQVLLNLERQAVAMEKRKTLVDTIMRCSGKRLMDMYFKRWAYNPLRLAARLLKFDLAATTLVNRCNLARRGTSFQKWRNFATKRKVAYAMGQNLQRTAALGLRRMYFIKWGRFLHAKAAKASSNRVLHVLLKSTQQGLRRSKFVLWRNRARESLHRKSNKAALSEAEQIEKRIADLKRSIASVEASSSNDGSVTDRTNRCWENLQKSEDDLTELDRRIADLESEYASLQDEFFRGIGGDMSLEGCASIQHKMLETFVILKAKSVMCGRDLKEIEEVRSKKVASFGVTFTEGIQECAAALHAHCGTKYESSSASGGGGPWNIDTDALNRNFTRDNKKKFLVGIRKAIIARDVLMQRHKVTELDTLVSEHITREVLANMGLIISCVDVLCKGHDFYTSGVAVDSSNSLGNTIGGVNKEPSPEPAQPTTENAEESSAITPYLGINPVNARGAIQLKDVTAEGPAAKAGLVPGDVITECCGEKVRTRLEFLTVVSRHVKQEGDPVYLKVLAKKGSMTTKIVTVTAQVKSKSFARTTSSPPKDNSVSVDSTTQEASPSPPN